jgi:anti-anti-sigma regulatory factor
MNSPEKNRIYLEGDLSIYRAAEIRDILVSCIQTGRTADLSKTGTVDSCAMQLFISAKKSAALQGLTFHIEGHSADFIRMLDLYGLISFFGDPVRISSSVKKELSLSYGMNNRGGSNES